MLRFCLPIVAIASMLCALPAHGQGRPCGPGVGGCFRDASGTWRDADRAFEEANAQPEPDHLRTAVEMAALLGAGTIWYWADRERNVADWDFASWEERMTWDAFRYDNNEFDINFFWHPVSGTGFYAFTRANDLPPWIAYLSSFGTSFAWEFLLEFKERVSINDQIVTPGAGIALGEFIYQLGRYAAEHDLPWLEWTLGLPVAFHDAVDGRDRPPTGLEHRFRAWYGLGYAPDIGDGLWLHEVGFDGDLVSIPGYLREGRFERFFTDANIASLSVRGTVAGEAGGLEAGTAFEMLGETTLLGYHHQSLRAGSGGLHGEAVTLGTSVSYLYRNENYEGWEDRLSVFGFPGLALDTHVAAGPVQLHLGARLQPIFGGVHSAAFPEWEAANPDQRPKSILRKQGYYYGWGYWGRLEAGVTVGALSVTGALSDLALDSHEGLDRTQSTVTADIDARDRRTSLAVDATLALTSAIRVGASVQHEAAPSRAQSSAADRQRREYELRLIQSW